MSALRERGARPLILPLIDFEQAEQAGPLDAALEALASGHFDWLVVSSATTVRALKARASALGLELAKLVPAATRVAAIGTETGQVLRSEGLPVDLVPEREHSAAGLAAEWPDGPAQVLLPQADIADSVLRDLIAAKGAEVAAVVAYHTVDYPARADRRLDSLPEAAASVVLSSGPKPEGASAPTLLPDEAVRLLRSGDIDAVVAASPSAARRIATMLGPLGTCRFIAIGRSTAAAARAQGLTVDATAKEPTPDGIVAALSALFATEGT